MTDLIVYDMKGVKGADKVSFLHDIFGRIEKRNEGKYVYKKKGLLDGIAGFKFSESVIATRSGRDKNAVIAVVRKYGIKFKIFRISIPNSYFNK